MQAGRQALANLYQQLCISLAQTVVVDGARLIVLPPPRLAAMVHLQSQRHTRPAF